MDTQQVREQIDQFRDSCETKMPYAKGLLHFLSDDRYRLWEICTLIPTPDIDVDPVLLIAAKDTQGPAFYFRSAGVYTDRPSQVMILLVKARPHRIFLCLHK